MTSRPRLESPYPGLRPFQKHEWPVFFGREPMIEAVLDRLAATQLVVIHGTSGCGKSSLIKAGVLPRLEQEHGRYMVPWRTAEMRPGSSPLWNLATAIARLHENLEGDREPLIDNTRTVRRLLNAGRKALSRIQERFGLGRNGNVCILLDQFEEVFRYAREIGREEAETLVEVLRGFERGENDAGLGLPTGIYALLTMRSDHLGDCGHFVGFAELVNSTQYLLPRMSDESLLRAIREPARLFGGEVSADLAVRLVGESHAEIDALPLIQHALMRLWRQAGAAGGNPSRQRLNYCSSPGPVLTANNYSGLEALLSEHAEEVLKDVMAEHPESGKVVEYLFRAITEIDVENRCVRRPRRLSALVGVTGGNRPVLEQVIRRFSDPDCGFLLCSAEDDEIIDISHEALIRCWGQLRDPTIDETSRRPRGWLQREREDERIWRSMLVQAEAGDRISPAILKDREAWFAALPGPDWAERYEGGWDKINKLLTSSRTAARLGRLIRISAAAAVLLLAAVSSWWTVGVTPRDGLLMLGLHVGLVNPSPEMIELPAGSFTMGSTEADRQMVIDRGLSPKWVAPEQPQHDVEIKQPVAISKYEVTFDEWDVCVADGGCNGYKPDDQGWGRSRRPVVNVSWVDAKTYVKWLSEKTGKPYRLLSEAEWEYAARARTKTIYSWGEEITPKNANYGQNLGKTTEVGSYPANRWGLYDMHGNVWEWVEDCWNDSYKGAPNDGSAWETGDCNRRVLRGGSWYNGPENLRSACRCWGLPDVRNDTFGFRVAMSLSPIESSSP